MANTKSAIKRNRQNERRRLRNRAVRSKLRTARKVARAVQGPEQGPTSPEAMQTLATAGSTGVIHRHTAARKKSALARRLVAR